MYAVIRSGSKQYRVEPGQELLVETLSSVKPGETIAISDVLLFADGDKIQIGQPVVPMTVHCQCVAEEKGPKLRTIKYRRRKNSKRTYGHRQQLMRLKVERFETLGN